MSRFPLRPAPLALAAALALAGSSLHAQSVALAPSAAPLQFNIAAKPLAQALSDWALQAHLQLIVQPSLVSGKTSPAVTGTLTPRQALDRLLGSSGLVGVQDGNAIVIKRAGTAGDAVTLGTVTVTGQAEHSGTTEGTGSYTQTGPSSTATGLPLSLRETPQSVSVITQQQMQDQGMRSLDDVADVATGLSYSKLGTERSYFYSRGSTVTDLQLDGMPSSVAESFSTDVLSLNNMAIYDRVEVVRGANGLLQGSGNPSATLNLVRKRPTREFQFSAEAGVGSWADYTGQVDVSGPLNKAGTLRGRAVLYGNNANSFRSGAGTDNKLFYGILEADISASTTVSLGAMAQRDNHKGYDWGGLPIKADGSFYDLPRSTSLAGPWAHLNRDNYSLFGDITHNFGNGWKVTAAANLMRSEADYLASISTRVSGDTYRLATSNTLYTDKQWSFNLKASGPFNLFGRSHDLILGATRRKDDLTYPFYSATSSNTVNILDFDFWSLAQPTINYASASNYAYQRNESGLFAATRLRPRDDLSVILGGRLSWADYATSSPTLYTRYDSGSQFVPYAGVVYDLSPQHTVYASYTSIYALQTSYGPNGLLDPVTGKNYEAGVKSSWQDNRLNTSMAVFQTDQLNLPVALSVASTCGGPGTYTCYTEGAKVRNRGFELEASGALTPQWNLAAGFTYSDPEYVQGPNTGKDYNTQIPRRLLKLSTDYRLPGGRWRVGGNVQLQSGVYYETSTYRVQQGSYSTINLHANYRHDAHWSVQFNVRNATDKNYYQTIPTNTFFRGAYYGAPRSFAVRVRYDY